MQFGRSGRECVFGIIMIIIRYERSSSDGRNVWNGMRDGGGDDLCEIADQILTRCEIIARFIAF